MSRSAACALLLAGAMLAACEDPYAVQIPSQCVSQSIATIAFINQSATASAYDVLIDGNMLAVLKTGATSQAFPVLALAIHGVRFNYAGTTTLACPVQLIAPDQCRNYDYVCKA